MSLLRNMLAVNSSADEDPYWSNVIVLMPFNGNKDNTTFVDHVGTAWTTNGNAKIDVDDWYFDSASGLFDGGGDYLTTPGSSFFDVNTEDLTVECFIKLAAGEVDCLIIDNRGVASVRMANWQFGIIGGKIRGEFVDQTTGGLGTIRLSLLSATTVSTGVWHHIAMTRSGNTVRLFLDGILDATGTLSGAPKADTGVGSLVIGYETGQGAQYYLNGRLDNLRVTKGVARYTASFTVPSRHFWYPGIPTDLFEVNYSSLLHFNGADASTAIADASGRSWSVFGNAQIDTAQFKFEGSSLLLGGSGDYITTPQTSDLEFGSGDFTLEAWVRPTTTSGGRVIISNWRGVSASFCAYILYLTTGGNLQLSYGVGAVNDGAPSTSTVTLNAWTHVVAQRKGTTVEYYINGVKDATTYPLVGALNTFSGEPTSIGCASPNTGASLFFAGHIDDVRITKGSALYSANFTPPKQEYFNGRVISLLHLNGSTGSTSIVDARGRAWTANGNAAISTAASKFGGASAYFGGSGDWVETPDSPDFDTGTNNFTVELWIKTPGNGAYDQICGQRDSGGTGAAPWGITRDNTFNRLLISYSNGTTFTTASGVANVFDDSWHHVALVRDGTGYRQYVDGVLDASLVLAAGYSFYNSADVFSIGRHGAYNGQYFKGYIDEFRYTRGVARYNKNFTPPAEAFV